ncbi:glycosyltransferase [Actinomycetospora cinnamomea]|uniref:glycosyltransferase n=1 Tax=Actinomycetospora cinnamomea TaxID=663609 RepID=UPI001057C89B|nr:glycosyltransferase [Actinomycetospora cinnamomea]
MSGLRVLVVTSYGDHTALTGGRLRRENVVLGLRESGHVVERVTVSARPGPRSAVGAARLAATSGFRRRARSADVVVLADVFCLPTMPVLRRLGVPVLVDLVDSPYRLVGSAPRVSWRDRISAFAQEAQLVPVMQVLLPMADRVTYISDEDVRVDAGRVRRMPATSIVPNGVDTGLMNEEPLAPPDDGYIAWLADWDYPPNRESLQWFVHEVGPHLPDALLRLVRLFGHGDPWPRAIADEPTRRVAALVERAGFVDDLADVYRGARAVIAPVTRGAGVNNKVVEPLAAGRPLLTTSVGVRGLPDAVRDVVRVADDGSRFALYLTEMAAEDWDRDGAAAGRGSVAIMSWRRSAEAMNVALHAVVAEAVSRQGPVSR